jgi:hypothetical protein
MAAPSFFEIYMASAVKQFAYYKHLGTKTMEALTLEEIHWKQRDSDNSIATLVKHLHGNMLSRWTDFLNSDGEKEWRERDAEFETVSEDVSTVMRWWEEGWAVLFDALESIQPQDVDRTVYIRNQGHSITDAVNRQLCHYAYHVGQMVLIGKMVKGENWESLSIPKGKSRDFNNEKFSKAQEQMHFTDEFLKDKLDKHKTNS